MAYKAGCFKMCIKNSIKSFLTIASLLFFVEANAIPVLQIGPDPADPNAVYDTGSQTWLFSGGSSFSFNIYNTGETSQTAYIVIAAVPMATTDAFDIAVSDDGGALTMIDSGYGTPPFEDTNSLAPHGIYDTWSEIYQVTFDGAYQTIGNTQPNDAGTGMGYLETITVDIASLAEGMAGLHIDLFTADFDATNNKQIVTAFAPFSHDGQYVVPVPASAWLFVSGMLGLVAVSRRKAHI
jgi:hypothetical protein